MYEARGKRRRAHGALVAMGAAELLGLGISLGHRVVTGRAGYASPVYVDGDAVHAAEELAVTAEVEALYRDGPGAVTKIEDIM